MSEKVLINHIDSGKYDVWLAWGRKLLIISFSLLLLYFCWLSQRDLIFVTAGLVMMFFSFVTPFRTRDTASELCWDLFAFILAFEVFTKIYEILVEQTSINFLMSIQQVHAFHEWVARWPLWLTIACNYIIADFLAYWSHRLFHAQWLWPAHAFHHSAKSLNWISGMRASLLHIIGLLLPYATVWVFFPTPKAGVIATGLLIFDAVNQHYLHSNIRFPLQRQIEWILVTPRYHFVHHSAFRMRSDSNYGFIFSLWDRCFGTFTNPETVDPNEPLGLSYEISKWRLLLGLPDLKQVNQYLIGN